MKQSELSAFLVPLALGVLIGWLLFKVPAVQDSTPAITALRTRIVADSTASAHRIDSLNTLIAQQQAIQADLDSARNRINANPKYRAHAYRDSTTSAKLDFIIGADRR